MTAFDPIADIKRTAIRPLIMRTRNPFLDVLAAGYGFAFRVLGGSNKDWNRVGASVFVTMYVAFLALAGLSAVAAALGVAARALAPPGSVFAVCLLTVYWAAYLLLAKSSRAYSSNHLTVFFISWLAAAATFVGLG